MTKHQAISVAIKCTEEMKKIFSQPKETMLKPRTGEEQNILNDGIKEIDEALNVLRGIGRI